MAPEGIPAILSGIPAGISAIILTIILTIILIILIIILIIIPEDLVADREEWPGYLRFPEGARSLFQKAIRGAGL